MEYEIDDNEIDSSDDDVNSEECDIFIKQHNSKKENHQRLRNRYAIEEILERRKLRSEIEDDYLF